MKRLSRKTYREAISDTDERKAISMLIFIKSKYRSSVVLNYTYSKLSQITGMHKSTVKKRLNTLGSMGLLETIGKKNQHLLFKSVRAGKSNVRLDKLDLSSVKSIEIGLQALYIVEEQNQKIYISHRVSKATQPKSNMDSQEYKQWKKAKRYCRQHGLTKFEDNGISIDTLAKRMRTSKSKVMNAIKYGQERSFFVKRNNYKLIQSFEDKNEAHSFLHHNFEGRLRVVGSDVVCVMCNTYALTGS